MLHPRRSVPLTVCALFAVACAARPPSPPVANLPPQSWTDPEGRFRVEVPGTPTPRDVQEITSIGAVNYRVYAVEQGFSYRMSAFAYPWSVGQPFDLSGELSHASGRSIARMQGTVEREESVVIDGVMRKDVHFSLTTEGERAHGIQRTLIGMPPVRYQAFCIGPADADLAPCEAFIRSFQPRVSPAETRL